MDFALDGYRSEQDYAKTRTVASLWALLQEVHRLSDQEGTLPALDWEHLVLGGHSAGAAAVLDCVLYNGLGGRQPLPVGRVVLRKAFVYGGSLARLLRPPPHDEETKNAMPLVVRQCLTAHPPPLLLVAGSRDYYTRHPSKPPPPPWQRLQQSVQHGFALAPAVKTARVEAVVLKRANHMLPCHPIDGITCHAVESDKETLSARRVCAQRF